MLLYAHYFCIKIVEVKDKSSECPDSRSEYENGFGKTGGLVTRMMRPIWGSSRVILLDLGFGYLISLQVLKSKGLYGTMVVRKRAYWLSGTEGSILLQKMTGKDVRTICVREESKDETRV